MRGQAVPCLLLGGFYFLHMTIKKKRNKTYPCLGCLLHLGDCQSAGDQFSEAGICATNKVVISELHAMIVRQEVL
jgi:hypothetical protein